MNPFLCVFFVGATGDTGLKCEIIYTEVKAHERCWLNGDNAKSKSTTLVGASTIKQFIAFFPHVQALLGY